MDVPRVLDRSAVVGLVPRQDSSNDPEDQRSISTVSVPGEKSLDDRLRAIADDAIADYESGISPGTANELNVTWDPVLAAGPFLGVLTTARRYTGGAHSTTISQSVYTDVASGKTYTSAELVDDVGRLRTWVADAAEKAELGRSGLPRRAATVRDLRFEPDGSLIIVLAQGEAGAEALGEVAVRVNGDAAGEALSKVGRQVQDAALEGDPFEGVPDPVDEPSAEPSTVAPATGEPQPAEADASPSEEVDCDREKCIALTFDDGPGPYTQKLLDELAAKDVNVTFFLIGGNVATQPDLVRKEVEAGHAIGNHSWDHPQLSAMSDAEIADEVDRTAAAIKDAAGVTTSLMRPPYGATNDTVASVLRDRDDAQILWNVDTEDWKNRDVQITTQRALDGAAPGAIILMHDIHPTTVQAVPGIIDALRRQGYTLVTVPQLLSGELKPGEKFFNR
ncbi:polysaccharide deacetylase family protein [Nocardioides lianchengensis]|uniref:polysaccharide deacetylase family protein n=1 Tax=Nocardioides lianchengensis TaxID=1045774 RepID=UPI00147F9862|nr:polysaccharide deacetylase family protein [Nocardioides lianchengensis]NYG09277.1 peptidoglycan/xylan/chitin deacetylase (PgdA/CDA1 family) [Nocardioides lianchengensis]